MRSIIQRGKELAIVMVVEGVENRKHHEFLREAGVFLGRDTFIDDLWRKKPSLCCSHMVDSFPLFVIRSGSSAG
jgi:hypothetical protein